MHYPAKIVAIDDDSDHLAKLEEQIQKYGSACLSIKYEGPFDLPENPIKGVRLVFMDIHLMKGNALSSDEKEFLPNLLVLKGLVSEDNGPYALITWTSAEKHNRLVNYLKKELPLGKRPFFTQCLYKSDYLTSSGKEYLDVTGEKLLNRLEKLYDTIPQMAVLLDWEKKVHDAQTEVLSDILKLSDADKFKEISEKSDAEIVKEISEKMDVLLSQLAIAARGKNASIDEFGAINDALAPLLHDKILHIYSENKSNKK